MLHRGDDDRRLQCNRITRRGPVADVRHRPEIPGKRPLLVRRRDDRHLHARPVGMQGSQFANARRHADGVGDGVRVDVGIARVRRVGHRRAPRLPSQLARGDHEHCRQRAAHHTGRGDLDERRETDSGQHDRPDVERQQVPGSLVRDGREDGRGDDDVDGEVASPEGAFKTRAARACPTPSSHRRPPARAPAPRSTSSRPDDEYASRPR